MERNQDLEKQHSDDTMRILVIMRTLGEAQSAKEGLEEELSLVKDTAEMERCNLKTALLVSEEKCRMQKLEINVLTQSVLRYESEKKKLKDRIDELEHSLGKRQPVQTHESKWKPEKKPVVARSWRSQV